LNIRVLRNEFDESFKTIKQITGAEKNHFNYGVVFVDLFNLVFVVFKDNSDELNECD